MNSTKKQQTPNNSRHRVPLVLDLWLSVLCMRPKAWLATRVSLRLARLPCTTSNAQRSRRLRSTRAAAPVLFAHAEVTKNIICFFMGPKLRCPSVHIANTDLLEHTALHVSRKRHNNPAQNNVTKQTYEIQELHKTGGRPKPPQLVYL